MKALTVWQPWATMIALGWKPIENRGWAPSSPGGLVMAIHAAAREMRWEGFDDALEVAREAHRVAPLDCFVPDVEHFEQTLWDMCQLHRGRVLATCIYRGFLRPGVEPIDVIPFDLPEGQLGRMLPWWERGSKGWILDQVKPIAQPPKVRGRQGLWNLPEAAVASLVEVS